MSLNLDSSKQVQEVLFYFSILHQIKLGFKDTLKQEKPVAFLCAAKIFRINEMSFLMTLMQLTQIF